MFYYYEFHYVWMPNGLNEWYWIYQVVYKYAKLLLLFYYESREMYDCVYMYWVHENLFIENANVTRDHAISSLLC